MRIADTFGRTAMIFDMDGTLLDSMPAWRKAIGETALKYGVALPDNFYGFIKNIPARQASEYLVHNCGVNGDPLEVFKQVTLTIKEIFSAEVNVKPYVKDVLESYRRQGAVMAILTGSERELADMLLEKTRLKQYFAGVYTCREAGGAKSSVIPFDFVLGKLGKRRCDAAVFEDGISGAATASQYGMYSVGVFDETSKEEIPNFLKVVDRYIYTFGELYNSTI